MVQTYQKSLRLFVDSLVYQYGIVCANRLASSIFFINAPSPVVTSNTIASAPAAIFLLMIELAIKGIELRSLSHPVRHITFYLLVAKISRLTDNRNLAVIDDPDKLFIRKFESQTRGSLLIYLAFRRDNQVLWPDILATVTPTLATNGARINVVVSPTPPVECLSTLIQSMGPKSITSPNVQLPVSSQ